MAQVSVRNLPDDVVERLKARARARGRSLEAEMRAILQEAAGPSREEFWQAAEEIALRIGRVDFDTTALIRADRDR
ncbi:MAG: FitA-like ribbon-helix-helix domain-containing protein [Egibacteraceae bacterium]